MQAGRLDRRVALAHRTLGTQAADGSYPDSGFTTYATVWAEKLDQHGREFFAAAGTNAERTTRFRIRYRSDVLQTDRIVLDSLNYDIVQVSEIGRREGLEIFARSAPT